MNESKSTDVFLAGQEWSVTVQDIEVLRKTYFSGLSDPQMRVALVWCQLHSWHPMSGFVAWWSDKEGRLQKVVELAGVRMKVQRSGIGRAGREPEWLSWDTGQRQLVPYSGPDDQAIVAVRGFAERWDVHTSKWHETSALVWTREVRRQAGAWLRLPRQMLAVRGEMAAYRRAFGDIIGDVYLREEIDGVDEVQPARRAARVRAYKVASQTGVPAVAEAPSETGTTAPVEGLAPPAAAPEGRPDDAIGDRESLEIHIAELVRALGNGARYREIAARVGKSLGISDLSRRRRDEMPTEALQPLAAALEEVLD